jgi:hypothetical protein
MNLLEIINNPEIAGSLTLNVNAAQLKQFAEMCINEGRKENPAPATPEEYLTPRQVSDALHITLVTLWNWDKKQITNPLRIGNTKRYRRSDLEKILCKVQ